VTRSILLALIIALFLPASVRASGGYFSSDYAQNWNTHSETMRKNDEDKPAAKHKKHSPPKKKHKDKDDDF